MLQNDQSELLSFLLRYQIHLHIFIKVKKWQRHSGIVSLSGLLCRQGTLGCFIWIDFRGRINKTCHRSGVGQEGPVKTVVRL